MRLWGALSGHCWKAGGPLPSPARCWGSWSRYTQQTGAPAPCPSWVPQENNGPHSPLHSLGSHQEGHEVSPCQLLPGHEGTPNKQGAQDHACEEPGQVVREEAGGQSLAPVPVPAPLPTDWRFSKSPEWSLPSFLWQRGGWGHLTASSPAALPVAQIWPWACVPTACLSWQPLPLVSRPAAWHSGDISHQAGGGPPWLFRAHPEPHPYSPRGSPLTYS